MWHSASLVLFGIDTALGFDVVVSQRKDQPHILKIIIIIKTKQLFQFSSTLFCFHYNVD
jgi:hypothetical protein